MWVKIRSTPCPRNGCWGRLYDIEATILFLGASTNTNTSIHSVQEWYDIPNRISKTPTLFKIQTTNLDTINCTQYRHFSSLGDVSQNYGKLEIPLLEKGIATRGIVGDATCVCFKAKRTAGYVGDLLQKNPNLFNDNHPIES